MRKGLILALLPVVALGGCALFGGGGGSTVDASQIAAPRNKPLVIPPNFNLPPPTKPASSAPGG